MALPKIVQDINNRVSFAEAQTLTDAQKAQARANIGAVSYEEQTLTDAQKLQARDNIGVGSLRNIGEIITSTLPLTDAGLHLLDGALIQGSGIYADFVDYIAGLDQSAAFFCTEAQWQSSVSTYGVCGKFVYDSTANTVRLPKITGIVEGTTDLTALGDLVEAGLPNITGTLRFTTGSEDGKWYSLFPKIATGAFYPEGSDPSVSNFSASAVKTTTPRVGFSAANSNPIYGNSATVQPQTIKTLVYIVIATVTKTEIQVDIDNIVTDLNSKVDISSPQTITGNKNFTGALQHNGFAVESVAQQTGTTFNRGIRFDSGLQICFGGATPNSDGVSTVTFSLPFIADQYEIVTTGLSGSSGASSVRIVSITNKTATGAQISITNQAGQALQTWTMFIAIGLWK